MRWVMKNGLVFLAASFGIGLVAACSSAPTTQVTPLTDAGPTDSGPIDCGGDCPAGTHLVAQNETCSCVPDDPQCGDPGICGRGMHWDFVACSCQPDGQCPAQPCPKGTTWDPRSCTCIGDDPPPPACFIPGYGDCYYGQTCVIGRCGDGTPISCYCDSQGEARCGGSCPIYPDGGPPPPPPDSGPQGCWLPGSGYCPPNTSCVIGYCPDNVTPISCYCQGNGMSQCTGACPPGPPPPVDAGWAD